MKITLVGGEVNFTKPRSAIALTKAPGHSTRVSYTTREGQEVTVRAREVAEITSKGGWHGSKMKK